MPKTLAVIHLKGGVGKSSLARALAVTVSREIAKTSQMEGSEAHPHVALFDCDRPMFSTMGWYEERKRRISDGANELAVPGLLVEKGRVEPPASVQLTVFDLPGRVDGNDKIDAEAMLVLARADLVLVPLRANRDDARELARLTRTLAVVESARRKTLPFRCVFTFYDLGDPEMLEMARMLRAAQLPPQGAYLRTPIRALTGWYKASNRGRVPSELQGRCRAADDQACFVREVMEEVSGVAR